MIFSVVPPNPMDWPLWARRSFLLTLPLSGSLWLLWWAAFLIGAAIFGAAVMLAVLVSHLLVPVVVPIIWLCETVGDLWSERP